VLLTGFELAVVELLTFDCARVEFGRGEGLGGLG